MALVTYPLDQTDYSMEDAALFHCTRSTGVYGEEDFKCSISGADNTLVISPGLAWMRLARFKGVATALKFESPVDLGLPDPVYPRVDHVVIQYDANRNTTELMVKNGTPSSEPQPPARVQSEALYEIHLYAVHREPGKASVSAKDITDLRMDEKYCGLMADSVTKVDTSQIAAQANALIEELHRLLQQTVSGGLIDGSVTTPKLAGEAVTAEKLAAGAVSTSKIARAAVTQEKIEANSVGYTELITASVNSAILGNDAVILDKVRKGKISEDPSCVYDWSTENPPPLKWGQIWFQI